MLNVAVHAGDDKRKEINLSPKTEQNVRNFLIELTQIMQKNNVTLEIISHTNRTKKVHQVTVSGLTVSNEDNLSIPKEFSISQNFPNPFNPVVNVNYFIPEVIGEFQSRIFIYNSCTTFK